MPKEPGQCSNFTISWYFDVAYGDCTRFWYGGCDGNENRFASKEECRNRCVSPPDSIGESARCQIVPLSLMKFSVLYTLSDFAQFETRMHYLLLPLIILLIGADDPLCSLLRWSPSQVLSTIASVCVYACARVCVSAFTALSGLQYCDQSW